jgi:hypothetical protein
VYGLACGAMSTSTRLQRMASRRQSTRTSTSTAATTSTQTARPGAWRPGAADSRPTRGVRGRGLPLTKPRRFCSDTRQTPLALERSRAPKRQSPGGWKRCAGGSTPSPVNDVLAARRKRCAGGRQLRSNRRRQHRSLARERIDLRDDGVKQREAVSFAPATTRYWKLSRVACS